MTKHTVLAAILGAKTTARFLGVMRLMVFSDTKCNNPMSSLKSNRFKGGRSRFNNCNAVSLFFTEIDPSISTREINKFSHGVYIFW